MVGPSIFSETRFVRDERLDPFHDEVVGRRAILTGTVNSLGGGAAFLISDLILVPLNNTITSECQELSMNGTEDVTELLPFDADLPA